MPSDPVIDVLSSAVSDLEVTIFQLETQRANARAVLDEASGQLASAEYKRKAILRTIEKMSDRG